MRIGLRHQPVAKLTMLRLPGLAHEVLAEMPVRGMQDFHC